ncbi:MAG: hypothetical protein AAF943_00825 [Pseudomonadota bacterium]
MEDFLPERIDVDLILSDAPIRLQDHPSLSVAARYLFGAPGADLRVTGEAREQLSKERAGWEGYSFGRYDVAFDTETRAFSAARTGADGQVSIPLPFERPAEDPNLPRDLVVTLRVAEGSGRPVERQIRAAIAAQTPLIGIKPGFNGSLERGA